LNPLPLHHGAIGNGRVLALVAPDTSIDWLCLPRFDSPSIFARLLDQERGGAWAFKPVEDWRAVAGYVRNTNVQRGARGARGADLNTAIPGPAGQAPANAGPPNATFFNVGAGFSDRGRGGCAPSGRAAHGRPLLAENAGPRADTCRS
jgi:hypothetical protein